MSAEEDSSHRYFQHLDELRRLTHYPLSNVRVAYERFVTFINPRKSPHLYSLSYEQFLQLFTLRGRPTLLPDDIVAEIYNRLEHDSKVDVLTAITLLAFMSRAPSLKKNSSLSCPYSILTTPMNSSKMKCNCSLKAPAMP